MVFNCSREMNRQFIDKQIEKCKSKGPKNQCSLKFFDKDKKLKVFKDLDEFKYIKESCDVKSFFYIQAPCLMPSKFFYNRQIIGLVVGCTGTLIYFFCQIFFEYISRVQ